MSNVTHLPAPVNPLPALDAAFNRLRSVVVANIDAARAEDGFSFAVSEGLIAEASAGIENAALADVLASAAPDSELVEVGGVLYRRMPDESKGVYFAMRGKPVVMRHLYRKVGVHNGSTIDPIALRCGLIGGRYTPAAGAAVAKLAQSMPTREGGDLCESLGVLPYSRSGMYEMANGIGQRWESMRHEAEAVLIQAFEIPDAAVSVSVAVDRVSLPTAEDREPTAKDVERGVRNPISVVKRMSWCGVWTLHDAEGEPLSSTRYAHIPQDGRTEMAVSLRADLLALLDKRPGLRVATLGDGAADIQGVLDTITKDIDVDARLVDFWHLTEKLADAARSMDIEPGTAIRRYKAALLTDDEAIEAIEQELFAWASFCDGGVPEELHAAMTYVENQRERLRYASVRAAKLPVGSGHVEATCKTIVTVRFKRPGARWRPPTAQNLLGLRALATSSRWKPAMKLLTASYVTPVTEVKNAA